MAFQPSAKLLRPLRNGSLAQVVRRLDDVIHLSDNPELRSLGLALSLQTGHNYFTPFSSP